MAHLRAQGRAQVDEDAIFHAVQRQREIVREAAHRTRSARKQLARTADAARGAPTRAAFVSTPLPAGVAPEMPDGTGEVYDAEPYPAERW